MSLSPNQKEMLSRTILLVRSGSHAYGMNTPESDEDFRGIFIGSREVYHGFYTNEETLTLSNPDLQSHELRKFFKLASDCNPNILETLYIDGKHLVFVNEIGKILRAHRELFVTQRAFARYSGYAISQIKRLQRHKRWIDNAPTKPSRSDYNLPEFSLIPPNQRDVVWAVIRKKVDGWQVGMDDWEMSERISTLNEITNFLSEMALSLGYDPSDKRQLDNMKEMAAMHSIGLSDDFIDLLEKERRYKSALEEWNHYRKWLEDRNEERAKMEKEFGYDGKFAAHAVRLLRMGIEIMLTGKVNVKRDDAEELLSIRRGEWKYDELMQYVFTMEQELVKIRDSGNSVIPKRPNMKKLEKLCVELIEMGLDYNYMNDLEAIFNKEQQ